MSVLVFIDHADGHVKKASLEAICYGAALAKQLASTADGIILGTVTEDLPALGQYGLGKVFQVRDESLNQLDAQVATKVMAEILPSTGANIIIFSHNVDGKAIAP